MEKTLKNGWVRVKGQGLVFDPTLAEMVLRLQNLDRQVFADCVEADAPKLAENLRKGIDPS